MDHQYADHTPMEGRVPSSFNPMQHQQRNSSKNLHEAVIAAAAKMKMNVLSPLSTSSLLPGPKRASPVLPPASMNSGFERAHHHYHHPHAEARFGLRGMQAGSNDIKGQIVPPAGGDAGLEDEEDDDDGDEDEDHENDKGVYDDDEVEAVNINRSEAHPCANSLGQPGSGNGLQPPGASVSGGSNGNSSTSAAHHMDQDGHQRADGMPSSAIPAPPSGQKPISYRECLKNHAATLGGHATDGCGEFMPGGEDGTLEALRCAACNCHRNFHRREVEGELPSSAACHDSCALYGPFPCRRLDQMLYPSHLALPSPPINHQAARARVVPGSGGAHPYTLPPQLIMPYPAAHMDSEEFDAGVSGGLVSPASSMFKKRYRTKFTAEQKEQMHAFAEKVGWRLQKQDEEAVQQFCAHIGVKRHVLKVWMHNNKHTLSKRTPGAPAAAMAGEQFPSASQEAIRP